MAKLSDNYLFEAITQSTTYQLKVKEKICIDNFFTKKFLISGKKVVQCEKVYKLRHLYFPMNELI